MKTPNAAGSNSEGEGDLHSRMIQLETNVAHLERLTEELNTVVALQQRSVDKLHHRLRKLEENLNSQELERIRVADTRPPHYDVKSSGINDANSS